MIMFSWCLSVILFITAIKFVIAKFIGLHSRSLNMSLGHMLLMSLLLTVLFISCEDNSEQSELMASFDKEKELRCQLESLKSEILQEWDGAVDMLDRNLPLSTPKNERENILSVKNANLIRMFQSYDNFPDSIKIEIDRVEQLDSKVAMQVRNLNIKLQSIKTTQDSLFNVLSNLKKSTTISQLKNTQESILKKKCE